MLPSFSSPISLRPSSPHVQLEYLSFLVLDEADRMADPGRFKELSSILGMLPPTAASLAAAKAKEAALAARDAARAAKKAARAAKIAEERDAARGKKGKGKAGMEKAEKEGKGEEEEEEKEEKEEEINAERGGEEGEEGREDGEEGEVGEEGEAGEEGGGEEVFTLQPPTLAKKKRQVLVFSATLVLPEDTRGQLQGKKRTPGGPGAADRRTGRKREREGAQGGEGGEEDEGEKEREKGLERDRVVAALMELTGMRPSPAIVDLTTTDVVASGVQEAALECDDSMRDVFLLYLLRMHGTFGRTLVFCSAISSVRRLASLLSLLQVPSFPLHAQQQQRQRLKALDRFKQHPSGVLVATDVAARGLDVPEVRLVVHYQLPHTAEGYVHRCGRTARGAASEGCSVALVTPKDSIKYSSLLRKLNKSGALPTFPVDHNYLPNLKQCVSLALSVDTLSRKHSKEKAETSWKQRASKAVQVNLEERGADVAGGEEEDEDEEGGGEEEREDGRQQMKQETIELQRMKEAALPTNLYSLIPLRVPLPSLPPTALHLPMYRSLVNDWPGSELEWGSSGEQERCREGESEVGGEGESKGVGAGEGEGGAVGGEEEGEGEGHGSSRGEVGEEGGGGVVGEWEGEEAGEWAGVGGEEHRHLAGGVVGEGGDGEGGGELGVGEQWGEEVGQGGWREWWGRSKQMLSLH
ncbi:unnamed protein product [Closterium sp. Naga37s-1]|nr:unnamed protein product [Closterium sp. Naga37s-1]